MSDLNATTDGGSRSRPAGDEWFDIVVLDALVLLGIVGFATAYGGSRYLVAGLAGILLGSLVAVVGARTRQSFLVVVAGTVAAFLLVGSVVAVPDKALLGVLPSPAAVLALVDGLVQGWAKLLTTLPPVGQAGNLLTVPFVCGLVASVVSLSIVLRTRRPVAAVVPPLVVLVLSILFGTAQPASLLLQGTIFGCLCIGWVAVRERNRRTVGVRHPARRRWAGAVVMLVLAGALATVLGPSLPGAHAHSRYVLRYHTDPPFDPNDYPSPLSAYRRYTDKDRLKNKTLLTVKGAVPGDLIRLATLDSYDGVVFSVGTGAGSSGYFQRIGSGIAPRRDGRSRSLEVEVRNYSDVWLPDVGDLTSVTFEGPRKKELAESFRFNLQTGTAAVTAGLRPGDRYRLSAVDPSLRRPALKRGEPDEVDLPTPFVVKSVEAQATDFAAGATTALARAQAIGSTLSSKGGLSDGDENDGVRSGHSAQRLDAMVNPQSNDLRGNGEQFAPLAALMARSLGIPARVVLGFKVGNGATGSAVAVRGGDVAAWIEVAIKDAGWVPVTNVVPTTRETPPPLPKPKPKPQTAVPPPPPPPLAASAEDETDPGRVKNTSSPKCRQLAAKGLELPASCRRDGLPWGTIAKVGGIALAPFWVLGGFTAVVAGLKVRRRRRRQLDGSPTERIDGGWREVTDLATDLGEPVPLLSTRREAAGLIGNESVLALAGRADSGIFGPGEPAEPEVEAYWGDVLSARSAMVGDRSRFERWKALVSLASLRKSGSRRRAAYQQGRRDAARTEGVGPVRVVRA